mmetsp:Transcript_46285/g.143375  ORF Transcript_46285/g.143375 Transcript_46285/m.143375 type:complete len:205 (-) Transcript_46285:136-750(-)|eukprot:CAMPEP_0175231370 /NCGR_PEP_ID=MMETSP0093-20121207/25422_1 /TAXON_ID=311494 /ORGANISM="Alexandrium monilatum, Strain CCMP3105" /LENGTH=204 /DNA_ID=CAMNT_0016525221 /DNA_START=7 /DNA_END=621 /DNA_ORIENTATION=-
MAWRPPISPSKLRAAARTRVISAHICTPGRGSFCRQLPAAMATVAGGASTAQRCLLVLNGKGLDTRGDTEESRVYFKSSARLADYDRHIRKTAEDLGVFVEHVQTNDLAECISRLKTSTEDAVVINPAGFMKEQALVDCIAGLKKPVFEVHYGNFFAKGATSLVTAVCNGIFCGAKLDSYALGMRAAVIALEPSFKEFDYPPAS